MKRTIIASLSVMIALLVVDYFKVQDYCDYYSCRESADGFILNTFIISLIVFLFSLVTYKMPKKVEVSLRTLFRIMIPIVFFVSTIIVLGIHHDPAGQWQDMLDLPALLILYGFFIIGSIIQIWRGYRSN